MRFPRVRTAVVSAVLGVAVAASPHAAEASSPTLTVTPGFKSYVAGQAMTFSGSLGVAGQRRIHLQFDMSGGKNPWVDVPGFSTTTNPDGTFRFTFPAPAMFNIRMHVVAAGVAPTPAWTFRAQSQELTLSVPGEVQPGLPFTVGVNTTPAVPHHPDTPPPAFPGRTLTLQQRDAAGQWQDVPGATGVTGPTGQGLIPVTGLQATSTLRVVEEDYTVGGDEIGWFPSFPYTVHVAGTPVPPRTVSGDVPATGSAVATTVARGTAATTYGWGRSLWDFAWEYGESLTSPPARGTDIGGRWLDTSAGSGRVMPHNGQLSIDSGPSYTGPGDVGTTRATLRDQGMRYGRWEMKVRLARLETGARDYHAVLELVPDRASDYHCGSQNITVADIPVYGSSLRFGVTSRSGHRWGASRSVRLGSSSADLAVEVAPGHITWFLDGRAIGTVKSAAAVSDVPLTPRISLVGQGTSEMNHTTLYSDWQRAWTLQGGRQVTSGKALGSSKYHAPC